MKEKHRGGKPFNKGVRPAGMDPDAHARTIEENPTQPPGDIEIVGENPGDVPGEISEEAIRDPKILREISSKGKKIVIIGSRFIVVSATIAAAGYGLYKVFERKNIVIDEVKTKD